MVSAKIKMAKLRKDKRKAKARRIGKKPTLAKLKKTLWALLAALVKGRDGNVCFSSGRGNLEGSGWHAGHLFPAGQHSLIRFHPLNIHSQSFHDNVNLGGNGAEYARRFIRKYGPAFFEDMSKASRVSKKWTVPEIETLIEKAKLGIDHYTGFYETRYGPCRRCCFHGIPFVAEIHVRHQGENA
jgi:hypothetical protein